LLASRHIDRCGARQNYSLVGKTRKSAGIVGYFPGKVSVAGWHSGR
jgi:hypothetical protein